MDIFIGIIVIVAYLVPSVIAGSKEHHQGAVILAINLFFGRTLIS